MSSTARSTTATSAASAPSARPCATAAFPASAWWSAPREASSLSTARAPAIRALTWRRATCARASCAGRRSSTACTRWRPASSPIRSTAAGATWECRPSICTTCTTRRRSSASSPGTSSSRACAQPSASWSALATSSGSPLTASPPGTGSACPTTTRSTSRSTSCCRRPGTWPANGTVSAPCSCLSTWRWTRRPRCPISAGARCSRRRARRASRSLLPPRYCRDGSRTSPRPSASGWRAWTRTRSARCSSSAQPRGSPVRWWA